MTMDKNIFNQAIRDLQEHTPKPARGPLYPIRQEEFERLLLEELFYYVQADRRRTFNPDECTRHVLASVSRWGTSPDCKPGLLLSGPAGTGKTSAVKALQAVARRLKSQDGRIIIPDLCSADDIAAWAISDNREQQARFSRCVGKDPDIWGTPYRVLGIDDLGTEPVFVRKFGNEVAPIVEVLTRRCAGLMPTIITTNLGPGGITERYGERIRSRVFELCEVVEFDGPDHRTQ